MKYSLCIDNNEFNFKVPHEFNSLEEIDSITSKMKGVEDLLVLVPDIKHKSNIYIKDNDNYKYKVIYNNKFLYKYSKEKINSEFSSDTLVELYNFLESIKEFSTSNKKDYLFNSNLLSHDIVNNIKDYSCDNINRNDFYKFMVSDYNNLRDLIIWSDDYNNKDKVNMK